MAYSMKYLAYIFLYIPVLFVPHAQSIDFSDRSRIERLPVIVALAIDLTGSAVIVGLVWLVFRII